MELPSSFSFENQCLAHSAGVPHGVVDLPSSDVPAVCVLWLQDVGTWHPTTDYQSAQCIQWVTQLL